MEDFAALLSAHMLRTARSANSLALEIGVDSSSIVRLMRGRRDPPRVHIVEALARGLELPLLERNRLLLAAGYAPASLTDLGTWPTVLQAVADVIACPELDLAEVHEFCLVVIQIAERWRRGLPPATPRYRTTSTAVLTGRNGRGPREDR